MAWPTCSPFPGRVGAVARGVGPGPVRAAPRGPRRCLLVAVVGPGAGSGCGPVPGSGRVHRKGRPWVPVARGGRRCCYRRALPRAAPRCPVGAHPAPQPAARPGCDTSAPRCPLRRLRCVPGAGRPSALPAGCGSRGSSRRTGRTAAGAGRSPGLTCVWGNGFGAWRSQGSHCWRFARSSYWGLTTC